MSKDNCSQKKNVFFTRGKVQQVAPKIVLLIVPFWAQKGSQTRTPLSSRVNKTGPIIQSVKDLAIKVRQQSLGSKSIQQKITVYVCYIVCMHT